MKRKIRVAVIFGGKSAEHRISLLSSRSVLENLDRGRYDITRIGIDIKGQWFIHGEDYLENPDDPDSISLKENVHKAALVPDINKLLIYDLHDKKLLEPVDVVFPVLHGPYGEDGTVQGLFKMMGVPFVGCDVLGSAICMDKVITKKLLQHAGIPTPSFLYYTKEQERLIKYDGISAKLGVPFFIKPASLGSSVGISKVSSEANFSNALITAFNYDEKIIIEEGISGREIECSVLGNTTLIASVPGEIIANDEFYSYNAKYIDPDGAVLSYPALLDVSVAERIRELAMEAFQALCCKGMARVDFFLREDGTLFVNELNTIPGFTKISMYPKLMEITGIDYHRLLDRLIDLAID